MSRRNQRSKGSALQEPRPTRKSEHRKVRHAAKQTLHVATAEGVDPDELVVPQPHPTHGYRQEPIETVSHSIAAPERRIKHWKQAFWKRRKEDRRRRVLELETELRKA